MQTTTDRHLAAPPAPAPPPTPEPPEAERDLRPAGLLTYLLLGAAFGFLLIRSEAVSWFRIYEMFRFQSFHMYGIIGSAVLVAAISVLLLRRFRVRTVHGDPIELEPKEWSRGYSQILGGILFGFGWALLGACPGPIYVLIGSGVSVMIVALLSAVAGAWAYGQLRPRLPH